MAYQVRVVAEAVMAGLPWLVIRRGRDMVLCVAESTLDRAPMLTAVLDGSGLLPEQRKPVDASTPTGL